MYARVPAMSPVELPAPKLKVPMLYGNSGNAGFSPPALLQCHPTVSMPSVVVEGPKTCFCLEFQLSLWMYSPSSMRKSGLPSYTSIISRSLEELDFVPPFCAFLFPESSSGSHGWMEYLFCVPVYSAYLLSVGSLVDKAK